MRMGGELARVGYNESHGACCARCARRTCSRRSSARSSRWCWRRRWAVLAVGGEEWFGKGRGCKAGRRAGGRFCGSLGGDARRVPAPACCSCQALVCLRSFPPVQVCKMILKIDDVIKPAEYE